MYRLLQLDNSFLLGLVGSVVGFFAPIYFTLAICLIFIFADCLTAYRLSVRVKMKYGKNEGKFKSEYAGRVVNTMLEIFMVLILAHLIDKSVLVDIEGGYVVKAAAGFFLFRQGWSILENISSESNNTWAKPLQKIMTNKAARHFEIDDKDFKEYMETKREKSNKEEENV